MSRTDNNFLIPAPPKPRIFSCWIVRPYLRIERIRVVRISGAYSDGFIINELKDDYTIKSYVNLSGQIYSTWEEARDTTLNCLISEMQLLRAQVKQIAGRLKVVQNLTKPEKEN